MALTCIAPVTDVPQLCDPLTLIGKNIKATGTIIGTRNDCRMALQFAVQVNRSQQSSVAKTDENQGAVKPVIETYSFKDIGEAVSKLKAGKVAGRCVVHFDQ